MRFLILSIRCAWLRKGCSLFTFVGSEGKVTVQKRSEMPFTCAFMEEVFRYRTLVPLGIQHCASEDAKLGKYVIPKGTVVGISSLEFLF